MTTAQRTQKPAAATQRAQVARALQAAQKRAQSPERRSQSGFPLTKRLVEPTFRGQRSVLLTIAGATVAVPAGARISVGIQPRSALVLDREQILHCLTVEDGRVVEIAGLPREYVAELRSRAFPSP